MSKFIIHRKDNILEIVDKDIRLKFYGNVVNSFCNYIKDSKIVNTAFTNEQWIASNKINKHYENEITLKRKDKIITFYSSQIPDGLNYF